MLLILQSVALGGMETHAVDLTAEYVRRGIQVMAIVPELPLFDELADRFKCAGACVERVNTDARVGRTAQICRWLRLLRIYRGFAPDVIHLHTPGATGGLAVAVTARLAGQPTLVITEHDVPNERWGTWDFLTRLAMDRLTHAVVAVSRRNAQLRLQRLHRPPRQFVAVLNGVPTPDVSASERQTNRDRVRTQLGISCESVVLGSLVRLDKGKGLHDLIEGFARMITVAGQPGELLLVGDGPLRAELEQLAAVRGVASHVHFAGQQKAPAPFLDAMDVFVLAVPAGSMSIALLEAMGRSLPAVITFCGPEEAVIPEQTGLCAPPNEPCGLGQVLARIAEDGQLRLRLGEAAGAHVRRFFSVERVADDLLNVYLSARQGSVPVRLRADSLPIAWAACLSE